MNATVWGWNNFNKRIFYSIFIGILKLGEKTVVLLNWKMFLWFVDCVNQSLLFFFTFFYLTLILGLWIKNNSLSTLWIPSLHTTKKLVSFPGFSNVCTNSYRTKITVFIYRPEYIQGRNAYELHTFWCIILALGPLVVQ